MIKNITPDDFTPKNLECAAAMIKNYAVEHNLTPENVVSMFDIGIFAFEKAGKLPLAGTGMTVVG
jgi:hypothetical protein